MKIAFNAIRVSNKAGSGFDTFIINFLNEFAKYVYEYKELNIEFDIFTLYPQHFPEVKKENIKHIKFLFLKLRRNKSSQLKNINREVVSEDKYRRKTNILHFLYPVYVLIGDYFRIFWTQFVFPFHLLKRKYDIVVSLTQLDALFFSPIAQVVTVHDMIPFLFPEYKHKHRFYLRYFFSLILQKTKKIITVSENTKNDIVKFFNVPKEKIFVIYEGIKKLNFSVSEKEIIDFKRKNSLDRYILCVSSNLPHKNLLRLIEAFYIAKNQKENIDLLIVGYQEKKYQTKINKKILELNLENKIKILGHISQGEFPVVYAGAELFVFPSLYEGFGLPPLEAMACGCPLVVSSAGSLPEVCGDAAVYVNPYSSESIAEGILKVLFDKNLRDRIVKNGFQQVKKFTWENSVKRFVDVLLKIKNNTL